MEFPDQTITQAVRSLRSAAADPVPVPIPIPSQPAVLALPAPAPTPPPPPPLPVAPAPPPPPSASASGTSASGSSGSSGTGSGSSGSSGSASAPASDIRPLHRRAGVRPTPPPDPRRGPAAAPGAPEDAEWSLHKWTPLLLAAAAFAAVFSAGPLLAPGRLVGEDGRPLKLKWATVAAGAAAGVLVGVYAVRALA